MDGLLLARANWTHFLKIKSDQPLGSLANPSSVTA